MKIQSQTVAPETPQYEKKSRKKFAVRTAIFTIAGGILGFMCAISTDLLKEKFAETIKTVLVTVPTLQVYIVPWIMLLVTVVCVTINKIFIQKGKLQIDSWNGEDNKHINIADTCLNKAILVSNIQFILIQILFSIVTYNLMKNLQSKTDCIMIFVTIVIYFISLFFTIRQQNQVVSLVKQYSPEKQGSIYDVKFQDIWFASCDEGERYMIYEASYKTMKFMNKVFSICLTIAIIAGMLLPIGMLCAIIIGLFWFITNCYYTKETMKLENER